MSSIDVLLTKIKSQNATWSDFKTFFELHESELDPFLKLAQEITNKNFDNTLKIYNPSKRFPAISITGSNCVLQCEHCNKKYLKNMEQILNNSDLEQYLLALSKNHGTGVLISGGCEENGSVPLFNFLDTIKTIKSKTNLVINVHTGLLNEATAKKLADAKVDIISFDVNLDEEIIRNIYHLDKDLSDYKQALKILKKYKLNIIPHICIGLYYGKLHKELDSIKFIKDSRINPELIVLIALIPPKESNNKFKLPNPSDIAKVIASVRFLFPHTEISLGCMRPRKEIKVDIEKYAIKAGITRIEIPSRKTLQWIKKVNPYIKLKYFSACCAIPKKFEQFALSKDSEIKRYLSL